MKIPLRTKLTVSFLLVITVTGLATTIIGTHLIGERIIKQAQDKVRIDLNSAREIYQGELNDIKNVIRLTAERFFIKDYLIKGERSRLYAELETLREKESLDILTLTDKQGNVIVRSGNPDFTADGPAHDPLIEKARSEKEAFASTEIISRAELAKENPDLLERAHIRFTPTPKAKPTELTEETAGMILKAAVPVLDYDGELIGILSGGNLINRNYKIVDKIKETVFQGQVYQGKDTGTATIFQGDLRISTNVLTEAGDRAIGTRVSEEVYHKVLKEGERWIERAFVVNDWYITAYEPIRNIRNEIIGILYVGTLEQPFIDIEKRTVMSFLGITLISIIIAFVGSYLLANSITRPIRQLASAAKQLADGDLGQTVEIKSKDEIGELGQSFNFMVEAIKERDEKLKEETQQALLHMEKMSSLGQMAAGVAHEINNPLHGILSYIILILKNLREKEPIEEEDLERKLVTMERETRRCTRITKSLLTFARQTEPSLRQIDIAYPIENSLGILKHQAELGNVKIINSYHPDLPKIEGDTDQLQQVFTNFILNAIDAMPGGGTLTISTNYDPEQGEIAVSFQDTGRGISPENQKKLFTPFFTTKKKGEGVGLGLAMSYGIIQRHGGSIEVASELDKGTTFTVRLKVNHNGKA